MAVNQITHRPLLRFRFGLVPVLPHGFGGTNQGAFRKGDYAEIMNKVSALSLLSNAALVLNTVRISDLVAELKAHSEPNVGGHTG